MSPALVLPRLMAVGLVTTVLAACSTAVGGDTSCEAEVVLIRTDGVAFTIGSSEVTDPTHFFSSPLEDDALLQGAAGKVVLQVRSDCSWAGMAWIPAG
jgi:ABC-type transporter Mla maintaining outer membrane lipid asymmetry permease subunit MlaE